MRLLLIVALFLSGCNRHEDYFGNTTPPARQILVFDNRNEPATLDPAIASGSADGNIIMALFEGLVQNDPLTTRPMAALATHYEVSADGMSYTFYLRGHPHPKGIRLPNSDTLTVEYSHGVPAPFDSIPARWSDGTVITARDFVYSWRRIADPRTAAAAAEYVSVLRNGRLVQSGKRALQDLGVAAPDDFTLRVDLEEPAPWLLSMLTSMTFAAVPRQAIEKAARTGSEDRWTRPENIVTNGPFTLGEWRLFDRVRVRASATYYQADLVRLKEIVFLPVGEGSAVVNLYRAGVTQAMRSDTLPEALTPAVAAKKDFRSSPYLGVFAYSINLHRPPFDNVLLRYALNLSIDKAAIGHYLNESPALSLMPSVAGYSGLRTAGVSIHGREYNVLRYNPGAARELLALAGYPNGIGTDGRQLAFDVRVWNDPSDVKVAEILARQWAMNLGVRARVSPAEINVVDAEIRAGNYYGLATNPWTADFADPMGLLTPTYVYWGSGGWTDPHYEAMLAEASRIADERGRFAKLADAEARIMRDMPIIPITFRQAHALVKPYVHALNPNGLNTYSLRYTWIDTGWKP